MKKISIIEKTLKYACMFKKQVSALLFFLFLGEFFEICIPFLIKFIVDDGYSNKDFRSVLFYSGIGFIFFLLSVGTKSVCKYLSFKLKKLISLKAGEDYSNKLFNMPLTLFRKKDVGSHYYSIRSDVATVADVISSDLGKFIVDISKSIVCMTVVFCLDAKLALLLVPVVPIFFWKSKYYRKKNLKNQVKLKNAASNIANKAFDSLSKMQLVKSFGTAKYEKNKYLSNLKHRMNLSFKGTKLDLINSLLGDMLSKVSLGIIGVCGMFLVIKKYITLGDLSAFLLYSRIFIISIESTLGFVDKMMSQSMIYLENFFIVLNTERKIDYLENGIQLPVMKGDIIFKDVGFSYDSNKQVINKCSFRIKPGEWTCLKGPSGCGKSTIVNLTQRMFDADSGDILIDGNNIRRIGIDSINNNIVIAGQEIMLFNEILHFNIVYGSLSISEDDIDEACKIAKIYDDIMAMPRRYEKKMGSSAFIFSTGQKQRLMLARALVKKPSILIMDEALSSVDRVTEKVIYQGLKKRRANLTTLIISHREEVAGFVDNILEMDVLGNVTSRK
jgi:ABC-type bacteriocin/lantibiotic exporter with double-glycine peptidase domain